MTADRTIKPHAPARKRALRPQAPKFARIEARCTPEQKAIFQEAAALTGRSETDFLLSALVKAAHDAIREHRIITLSHNDATAFAQAIINPPEPNDAAREAAQRYLKTRTP